MTWFRVGGAGIPATLKNAMNAVFNKKFGTSGQNYPPKQWPDDVNLLGPLPEGTATGSVANFSDGADRVPTKNVIATIAPNLDGVSSVDVVNCGKNLYDVDGAEYNGEFYDASGNIVQYADCAVSWIKVNASTQYSFSCTKETSQTVNVRIAWCKSDKSFISRQGLFSDNQFSMTLTTPSNCEWLQLSVNQYGAASIEQNNWSIQVEKSAAATTFEPYSGTTNTANLGRTIYGGTADIVTGEGQYGEAKIKINQLSWTYVSQYGRFQANDLASVIKTPSSNNVPLDGLIAEGYITTVAAAGSAQDRGIAVATVSGYVLVYDSRYTDVETFLSAEGEKNIVYPLVTPSPFAFTPITPTPKTVLGVNNFWNDAGGDTTVVYRRDIDLALQAVSSSRGLMMASRPVTQLVGEESDPDQVNELVENDETEQEGEDNAR